MTYLRVVTKFSIYVYFNYTKLEYLAIYPSKTTRKLRIWQK